jgi:hypothetical protein
LIAALPREPEVKTAIDDTLRWLRQPERWHANPGGEGGSDDKRLARIQFGYAATVASAASLVPADALKRIASIVKADQRPDGSWRLDSSDSLGSPATYGTALATAFARRALLRSGDDSTVPAVSRAEEWLKSLPIHNVPDAAAIIFTFADGIPAAPNWRLAQQLLQKGQGQDGGWGPYVTSPAESFDTALALLALCDASRRESEVFTPAALKSAIESGRAYLLRQQLEDGSWPETTRPSGQSSYAQRISTTAWALLAMIETESVKPESRLNVEEER